MARPQLILPRADSACGKVFFSDRRTAEGHRIALEVWNQATGRVRDGYRLAVYRCKRCGGFHIGQRPIDRIPARPELRPEHGPDLEPCERDPEPYERDPEPNERDFEPPRVRRVSRYCI